MKISSMMISSMMISSMMIRGIFQAGGINQFSEVHFPNMENAVVAS